MFSPFPLKPQSSKGKILFQTKSKANPSLHSSIETKDLKGLKNGESSAPPSKSLPYWSPSCLSLALTKPRCWNITDSGGGPGGET